MTQEAHFLCREECRGGQPQVVKEGYFQQFQIKKNQLSIIQKVKYDVVFENISTRKN